MLYKIIKKWHYFLSYDSVSSILNYCYDNVYLLKKYCSKETNYMNLNKIHIKILLTADGTQANIGFNEIQTYSLYYLYNFRKTKQLLSALKYIKIKVVVIISGLFFDYEINNNTYLLKQSKFIDNIGVHERIYNKIICL